MPSTSSKPRPRRPGKGSGPAALASELVLACPEPMYIAAADGTLLLANAAYRALAAPDEAAFAPLAAPDEAARVIREGRSVEQSHRVGRGDAERTFSAVHTPLTDAAGNVVAVGGHYRETTGKLRAERRLDMLGARLDDLNRLLSDWVWEVDASFRFLALSPRAMEALGRPPAALVGTSLFDLGGFVARDGRVPSVVTRSPFNDQVFRSTDLEGAARYNRLTGVPVFDARGGFAGFRGVGTDITAQIEAESRAANAQMRLVEAIEAVSEGFALFDAEDRLLLCNRRLRELYPGIASLMRPGVTFETLLRRAPEYTSLAEDERERRIARRMAAHRQPGEALEELTADGCWVLISEQRTRDDGVVSVFTEITELKRRELELAHGESVQREAREAAEAANQAKSSFLANVSHELRTPLNAVIGFSEIIKNELYGPVGVPQYLEYVRDIHDSGRHLLNLINDILDFSKAEAGKLTLHDSELSVPAVAARCRRFVEEMALAGGVTLADDIPETVPGLRADDRKVKQMLLNLLSNAVKFTPGGGTVTTRVRLDIDGTLVIAVVDTGQGMAEDEIPKALSPFVQLEDALTRRHQGTGLGLPLTRSLIELHGGALEVESRVGIGTTVALRFPVDRVLHKRNSVAPIVNAEGHSLTSR